MGHDLILDRGDVGMELLLARPEVQVVLPDHAPVGARIVVGAKLLGVGLDRIGIGLKDRLGCLEDGLDIGLLSGGQVDDPQAQKEAGEPGITAGVRSRAGDDDDDAVPGHGRESDADEQNGENEQERRQ